MSRQMLAELGVDEKPVTALIEVWNKADLLDAVDAERALVLPTRRGGARPRRGRCIDLGADRAGHRRASAREIESPARE